MSGNTDISSFIVGGADKEKKDDDECIEKCIKKSVKKSVIAVIIVLIIFNIIQIILYIAISSYYNNNYNTNSIPPPSVFNNKIGRGVKKFFGNKESMQSNENSVYTDELSNCGWEVHVLKSCPYCVKQKEVLNKYFPNFTKIHENKDPTIPAVPAWKNSKTGEIRLGLQTYENIKEMISTCSQ